MKSRRQITDIFSISFLDVISCGFGAIIILMLIVRNVPPDVIEQAELDQQGLIQDLQRQLFELRGETQTLNRQMTAKHEQLSLEKARIARLRTEMELMQSRYARLSDAQQLSARQKGELELARQSLTEEMRRLLGDNYKRKNDLIGGIPVDSEYIIFIIDTSGSMVNYGWQRMIDEIIATLDIYPNVKGIQIMNDMGDYMFSNYRREWIPDTPARRSAIIQRLRGWHPFSNSSPVEGVLAAIRSFYAPDKKISIYVFGDEFTGRSIKQVVDTVSRINQMAEGNQKRVRIHAVGLPVQFANPPQYQMTGIRFAALMRELTLQNGGTFIGLNDFRPGY
ncbi:hypothetical protein KJY73_05890 [Bowmanella sp. Y26]|uniref:vWA domain-containing protein n=1 Tax=Bowmanella yangjiangensis TaxID=2811230 RepID=UPI001BDCDC65|nr:vWA domain-containing protein [Bowmanella yangjiangensis]MBT1063098.1 hypothetical protein [Bowmanella yangjiangensis]